MYPSFHGKVWGRHSRIEENILEWLKVENPKQILLTCSGQSHLSFTNV